MSSLFERQTMDGDLERGGDRAAVGLRGSMVEREEMKAMAMAMGRL